MGVTAAVIGAVAATAGAANSIQQSRRAGDAANRAADAADPFAGMRPQFQDMLSELFPTLTSLDPNAIKDDPQYQFMQEQGFQSIDNAASASGLLRSGNRDQERMKFASGLAGQFADARFNRQMGILGLIAQLAGGNIGSPSAAGNAILQGNQNQTNIQNSGWNAFGGAASQWADIAARWGTPANQGGVGAGATGSGNLTWPGGG